MIPTGIYVRVSREIQAEKVSPDVQEQDCRVYCESKGYNVVEVYRDVEKYRIGNRLIEPSGTRADRPAFRRMIADAYAGKIKLIVGWREDRLYRGARPMLDICDCIEQCKVEVELVKETFDKRIAPVKAWAAKMELDARKDRTAMGMIARFGKGKVWTSGIPFGYCKDKDGFAQVHLNEGAWVAAIWKWRAEGKSLMEIRHLLIENEVPQRRKALCKHQWQFNKIQNILRNPVYYTGHQKVSWEGNDFEIPYPVLIEQETANLVIARHERERQHPARHLKYNYLAMGLAYCVTCGLKMASYTRRYRANKTEVRKTNIGAYVCQNVSKCNTVENCVRQVGAKKFDAALWRKVSMVLTNDSDFESWIETRIEELRRDESEAQSRIDRIQTELGLMAEERQWIITQARKKTINEKDMEMQLSAIAALENELKRELADKSLLIGSRADRLMQFINQYRANMRGKITWLNREAQTAEEREEQFKARRHIVETIVKKIVVNPDQSIRVVFEFDLTGMAEDSTVQINDHHRSSTR